MGRGCRRLAAQEHECVQWPVRVEVSVQGFHVSVQGWGWGTRNQRPHLKEGEQIGLPIGPVSVPGWCARAEARSPCSPAPTAALPSVGWWLCRPLGLLLGGTPTLMGITDSPGES